MTSADWAVNIALGLALGIGLGAAIEYLTRR